MKKIACLLAMFICFLLISVISFADVVKLPDDLTEIKEEAFCGDTSITEAIVPKGTKTIGARAFANSGLRRINLPASVNSIDATAFTGVPQDFLIVAPYNSYGYQYAMSHHYRVDIKESYTVESDIGDNFVIESIIDSGQDIVVICSVLPEYSNENGYTSFVLSYGILGNQIISETITLDNLKQGFAYSFSKDEISQHSISPVITLHIDIKDTYTIKSDIGDNFVIESIIDSGQDILVLCSVLPEYSGENSNGSFVLSYGIEGNQILSDEISVEKMKQGYTYSISKDRIKQHRIPSVVTLYIDMKDSYDVESDIGAYFVVHSIIDSGQNILVRCSVMSDYSADINSRFTLNYGVNGNCIHRDGISLGELKQRYNCSFSKAVINQYHVPAVISLYKE